MVGGTTGDTSFTTLDVDGSLNIAVGGSSSDPDVVGVSTDLPRPILIYIYADGRHRWAKTFDSKFNSVIAISFKNDYT